MNSTAGASVKDGSQAKPGDAMKVEDEAAKKKQSDKRKADTDCQNAEFEFSLKQRA